MQDGQSQPGLERRGAFGKKRLCLFLRNGAAAEPRKAGFSGTCPAERKSLLFRVDALQKGTEGLLLNDF